MDQKTNDFLESLKSQISEFQAGDIGTPPIVGTTVASDAADLMDKVSLLGSSTGDYTIGLKDGHHDVVSFNNLDIGGKLTIVAENSRGAKCERINLNGNSKNIKIDGIGTCPKGEITASGLGNVKLYGITASPQSSFIEIENAFCQGHLDSANHAYWSKAEWRARGIGGIFLQGQDSSARNIYCEGVRFGVNLTGDRSLAENCYIFGASGDAFRGAAHDLTFRNCLGTDLVYMDDGNHPDLFQVFLVVNGTNITVRGLRVEYLAGYDWTVRSDNPMRFRSEAKPQMQGWGRMQGVGMHQTMFLNPILTDIYIRTPIANGIHIGGTDGLYGRRWNVLNSDYGLPSFDTRFPKISVNANSANNPVDVEDTIAEAYSGNLDGRIVNQQMASAADYTVARPQWIDEITKLAA